MLKGNMCPTFEKEQLIFSFTSDILGTSIHTFELNVKIEPDEVTYFDFEFDWRQSLKSSKQ